MIATASIVVAGVSAHFGKQSAETSRRQLALVARKIGMLTDPSKMTEVLPVWYVDRMGQDSWGFGLLLASGELLAIERITGVSNDRQWQKLNSRFEG